MYLKGRAESQRKNNLAYSSEVSLVATAWCSEQGNLGWTAGEEAERSHGCDEGQKPLSHHKTPGTSLPESFPHGQLFIPFFSKDKSPTVVNYRSGPKVIIKTWLLSGWEVVLLLIHWKNMDLTRDSKMQLFSCCCPSTMTTPPHWPVFVDITSMSNWRISGFFRLTCQPLHLLPTQILNPSNCIRFMYLKTSL